MKPTVLASVTVFAVLLTGCPRNEYIVELRPRENVMERALVFFRADGADANGVPNYQAFPSNELAAITRLYPSAGVRHEGERHFATGVFGTKLPSDVGGHGIFTNLATSLGSAGFYLERFRGNPDLAAQIRQHTQAADQLADWIVGWSRVELGREPHYADLRRFLDRDFRRDLQNLGLYAWLGSISTTYKPGAEEEFIARFGQYLLEHGYLKPEDAPSLFRIGQPNGERHLASLVQRLVAKQLGMRESDPTPPALAFLADPEAVAKSWERYLAGTDRYRARLRQWQRESRSNPESTKPEPTEMAGECASRLLAFGPSGSNDRLTVHLFLPLEPTRTNGRWDAARKQVLWECDLEAPAAASHLPAFSYASWSTPDERFQRQCFGRVALRGDRLVEYCLWRASLAAAQAGPWEALLASLRPDDRLDARIESFRFAGEPPPSATDAPPEASAAPGFARALLQAALHESPPAETR